MTGAVTLASAVFDFILIFFPAPMYPLCYPDGPFTAQAGATIHMNVTTEPGYPQVDIHRYTPGSDHDWISSFSSDGLEDVLSLLLTITEADQGNFFNFTITSPQEFPGRQSSCLIGPITVVSGTTSSVYSSKTTADTSITTSENFQDTTGQSGLLNFALKKGHILS